MSSRTRGKTQVRQRTLLGQKKHQVQQGSEDAEVSRLDQVVPGGYFKVIHQRYTVLYTKQEQKMAKENII
jgi:hypothetical protein